ncbi:hypothetical protein SSS_10710, partial [Sarcoptes scabiei]
KNLKLKLRLFRSTVFYVALKYCPEKLLIKNEANRETILETVLEYLEADDADLIKNGLVAFGYAINVLCKHQIAIPTNIIKSFCKVIFMKNFVTFLLIVYFKYPALQRY